MRTLHYYETIGLLIPNYIDECTNYRYYTIDQLESINKIKVLQEIGFSLKDIKFMMKKENSVYIEDYYCQREDEIQKEILELKVQHHLLKEYMKKSRNENYLERYSVSLKQVSERNVVSVREKLKNFQCEGKLWERLFAESEKKKVDFKFPLNRFSFYHDLEYKEANVDIEIQASVNGQYQNTEFLTFFNSPSFTLATTIFNGGYEQISEITIALALWIEAHQYKISGPLVTIFHTSPSEDINPNNWVTEVGFIVEKDLTETSEKKRC